MSFLRFESETELIDEVKRKLGHPMVKVELDESQWRDVVKQTKRWFLAKKSIVSLVYKKYNIATSPIPFSDIDPVNGVYKIIEVFPDESQFGSKGEDNTYYEILPFGYPVWGSSNYAFGSHVYNRTSYIMQVFESLERRRRIYGSDMDWFVQEDYINGHKLFLTPNSRARCYGVVYKPATLPLQALEGRDADLVFQWCLAEAKETLGRVRSKYKDYPAAGGTISTDGDTLLEEAKADKERLTDEVAGSQGPMPVLFG
jgi:hypothetical protein